MSDYISKMRKASQSVYLICEKSVAEDLSDMLQWGANRLEHERKELANTLKEHKKIKECLELYADKDNWDLVCMSPDGEGSCAPIFCDDHTKASTCLNELRKDSNEQ